MNLNEHHLKAELVDLNQRVQYREGAGRRVSVQSMDDAQELMDQSDGLPIIEVTTVRTYVRRKDAVAFYEAQKAAAQAAAPKE